MGISNIRNGAAGVGGLRGACRPTSPNVFSKCKEFTTAHAHYSLVSPFLFPYPRCAYACVYEVMSGLQRSAEAQSIEGFRRAERGRERERERVRESWVREFVASVHVLHARIVHTARTHCAHCTQACFLGISGPFIWERYVVFCGLRADVSDLFACIFHARW